MSPTTKLPRRLLGIWPHPDDESYLSAGLMARMRDAGRDVTVLTMTHGEKGTSDADDYDQAHFAAVRARELRASLATLGVHDLRFGAYRDGECEFADHEVAIGTITEAIRSVRPDTIVTFGPDGITGHRDHRVVSSWVTEAWRRVGGADLLYATMNDDFVAEFAELHTEIGIFAEYATGPASYPVHELALEVVVEGAEVDRKRAALAAHGSQTDSLAELMGEDVYRTWWRRESFRRPSAVELASSTFVPRTASGSVSEEAAA